MEDSGLIISIREGSEEAFRSLYSKYFKLLVRYAWYRTNSIELSRDLVQDIFFKLWQKRNSLNPQKSIKAYLYRSLINSIIDHKNLKSSKNVSLDKLSGKSEEAGIESGIDLQNAVNMLPEKLRTVYILSRLEGYKYSEIAEICSLSIKAVEKRMAGAFKQLQKFLYGYPSE